MAKYIDREKAIDAACEVLRGAIRCGKAKFTVVRWIVEELDIVPAADVAPVVHARWEGYTHSRYCGIDEYGEPIYRDGIVYYCSNPKCRRRTVIKENYCPACGRSATLREGPHGGRLQWVRLLSGAKP